MLATGWCVVAWPISSQPAQSQARRHRAIHPAASLRPFFAHEGSPPAPARLGENVVPSPILSHSRIIAAIFSISFPRLHVGLVAKRIRGPRLAD